MPCTTRFLNTVFERRFCVRFFHVRIRFSRSFPRLVPLVFPLFFRSSFALLPLFFKHFLALLSAFFRSSLECSCFAVCVAVCVAVFVAVLVGLLLNALTPSESARERKSEAQGKRKGKKNKERNKERKTKGNGEKLQKKHFLGVKQKMKEFKGEFKRGLLESFRV